MQRLSRFQFLAHAAALGCAALLACSPAMAADSARPNIIFILSDDLSYRDLSAYGQRAKATNSMQKSIRANSRTGPR